MISGNLVALSMNAFLSNDESLVLKVYENEKLINILEKDITEFLVKLSNTELSEAQLKIVTSMFHVVNDIERIGDHAENLADLTSEKINKNLGFSEQSLSDLNHIYNYTIDALNKSIHSFENNNLQEAQSVSVIEDRIDSLEKELRETNIKRLHNGSCSPNSSAIFLDLLSNFERIGDHAMNIAETIINR